MALVGPLEVGRGGSGLLVDDPSVSRLHLELRPEGEDVRVLDLGSANGTTVDGVAVDREATLGPGSVVRLGDTTIELATDIKTPWLGFSSDTEPVTSITRVAAATDPKVLASALKDGTITIVFSDIESSTELAQKYGDARWYEILEKHKHKIESLVTRAGGTVVKSQGDGFLLTFTSAHRALRCAVEVQRTTDPVGEPTPERPFRVRLGAHTGEAIIGDSGDLVGHHVNVAARIADEASGGEILVSSLVKEIVDARKSFTFGQPRTVTMKGLDGQWLVHPVLWNH